MISQLTLVAADGGSEEEPAIEIGHHVEWTWRDFTFNLDTIWATVLAGTIVVGLGFLARKHLTKDTDDHVPTKLQLTWETLVSWVSGQVEDNLGRVNRTVVALAVALFFFILIANWFEIVPSAWNDDTGHLLAAPTADTNLTYAMALMVFVGTWIYGIRERGLGGYFGGFISGSIASNKIADVPARMFFTLLNILEELIKPVTLALRLFGNIFAGGIMLALIGLLPIYVFWGPNIIWKLFDMFIGGVQAFIFALLTILYFGMAGTGHGGDDHDEHPGEHHDEHPGEHPDEHQAKDQPEKDTADTDSTDEAPAPAPAR
jgi:F-type H+-transporting ATPase subunit a